jgi:hypothetical protein
MTSQMKALSRLDKWSQPIRGVRDHDRFLIMAIVRMAYMPAITIGKTGQS